MVGQDEMEQARDDPQKFTILEGCPTFEDTLDDIKKNTTVPGGIHPNLSQALYENNFKFVTPIQ